MTIEEIKAYLESNKEDVEVKAFLAQLSPEKEITSDDVDSYLKTDEGKSLVQPMIDSAVTKAVKTRDKAHQDILEKEVKTRVASELLKANPEKSPLELKVMELEEQNKQEKAERAKDNLKRQVVEEAAKLGINPFFIDDYIPESIDVARLFLNKIKTHNDEIVKKASNELLANGYKPNSGKDSGGGQKLDFSKMSQAELIKLEMDGTLDVELAK